MDPFTLIASLVAVAASSIVTAVSTRKQRQNTLTMFDKETETNRENWQMQNDYDRNQLNRTIRDAQQSGVNPLSVLGSPSYSASAIQSASGSQQSGVDTSMISSLLPFVTSMMTNDLERQKNDKDNEVKNAEIDKITAETESIRQRNQNQSAKNDALVKSFADKGIEIPRIGATGFVDGLDRADELFTNSSDRSVKRAMNQNLLIVEQLKSQPEYLEKMQTAMYAELDQKVVDLDTSRELLTKAKLDNKKAVQEIEINNVRYQVVKTELAEKLFNLNVIQPKQAQSLDLANSNARADFENKYMQQEYMLFKVMKEREQYGYEKQTNPFYWTNEADKACEDGDYAKAGVYMFNSLFYSIPHLVSSALGIKNIGKD